VVAPSNTASLISRGVSGTLPKRGLKATPPDSMAPNSAPFFLVRRIPHKSQTALQSKCSLVQQSDAGRIFPLKLSIEFGIMLSSASAADPPHFFHLITAKVKCPVFRDLRTLASLFCRCAQTNSFVVYSFRTLAARQSGWGQALAFVTTETQCAPASTQSAPGFIDKRRLCSQIAIG